MTHVRTIVDLPDDPGVDCSTTGASGAAGRPTDAGPGEGAVRHEHHD